MIRQYHAPTNRSSIFACVVAGKYHVEVKISAPVGDFAIDTSIIREGLNIGRKVWTF